MTLVNDCLQCSHHDAETKRIMDTVLHEDERLVIAFSLGAMVQFYMQNIARLSKNQDPKERMRALQMTSHKDHAVQVMGKIVYTLDERKRAAVEETIWESYRLKLNFSHEKCPHRGEGIE